MTPINIETHLPKILNRSQHPQEIIDLLEFLSMNPKIVFKSQQRNDPELLTMEKVQLAQEIYERNPQIFLLRFGRYLEEQHLIDFARISVADSDDEMHQMISDYRQKLQNRKRDVKNRRYAALQSLIREGEYFSEQEMMKRSPELYHELIGQYLSSSEKEQRDSYDVRNTTFSGILMHTADQREMYKRMKEAEEKLHEENNNGLIDQTLQKRFEDKKSMDNYQADDEEDEYRILIPENCRKQWGNFEGENIDCSISHASKKKSSSIKTKLQLNYSNKITTNRIITAEERNLLRQEFLGIMYEQFLSGHDHDFDYTNVDDNTQYDDLQQINQDKEDQYFAESDINDEYDDVTNDIRNGESEDELDVYMHHLKQHHSLQKHEVNIN